MSNCHPPTFSQVSMARVPGASSLHMTQSLCLKLHLESSLPGWSHTFLSSPCSTQESATSTSQFSPLLCSRFAFLISCFTLNTTCPLGVSLFPYLSLVHVSVGPTEATIKMVLGFITFFQFSLVLSLETLMSNMGSWGVPLNASLWAKSFFF